MRGSRCCGSAWPTNVPDFDGQVAKVVTALDGFESARTGVLKALQGRFVLAAEVRPQSPREPAGVVDGAGHRRGATG